MITILVVDDEPLIRDLVADVLRDAGYAVLTAPDGQAALEVVAREPPSLVLMDMMMPRMDGPTAYRAMRQHPHGAGLPVILMSAATDPVGLDAEALAFVPKPFDLEQLLALIALSLPDG